MLFSKNKEYKKYYDAYFMLLFKTTNKQINNLEDAKDICHDVFLKFFQKIDEIEHKKAWLFGTLRFEILNYLKKKRKDETDLSDIDELAGTQKHKNPEHDHDLRILINEAMQKESAVTQSIFELKSVYKWSFEDIARHHDMSYRQVQYQYHQATKRLYSFFIKKGITRLGDLL